MAHASAGGPRSDPALANEPATAAAAAVLTASRTRQRSCALVIEEDGAAAASVMDRGRVVAALGITGDVRVEQLAVVAVQAQALSRKLPARDEIMPAARS